MKLIILAAGRGERLMPLTQNTPKPLIDMGNGNTLLEEQLRSIQEFGGIEEIVLVVGYLADQISAKIRAYRERGFKIRTLFNPFWSVSNNLLSLWLARQIIADSDVMITNGDNIFNPHVFSGLTGQDEGIWLSACPKTAFDADDMKVVLNGGLIERVSKLIPAELASAESPGLVMIKGERARELFVEQMEGLVSETNSLNLFWLEIFNRMWTKGIPVKPWFFDSQGNWQEVDFHLDVKKVRDLLTEKLLMLHINDKSSS
jgi:choline kinase